MTTEPLSPLTVFRNSRDIFLNSVVTGVSGLESAVLEFERDHARRTAAAESEAARLRGVNADLLAELGEKAEALRAAETGIPVLPAADPAELEQARETISELRRELESRPEQPEPAPAAPDAGEADQLRRDLAASEQTLTEKEEALREEVRRREQAEADARNRRSAYHQTLTGLNTQITGLEQRIRDEEDAKEARDEAARIAARNEALAVIKAVAADSPDTPLDEALDIIAIAMAIPAGDTAAPEPAAGEGAEEPVAPAAPVLEIPDFDPEDEVPEADAAPPHEETPVAGEMTDEEFFGNLEPPVIQEQPLFGAPDADPAPDSPDDEDDELGPQVMFDIDAPLPAEPEPVQEVPKPGFGLFRKGTGQAA
ncbi:hypothetical protein [Arthrobacter caoxuetaonis]|uniref:Uncharacterized protein n=1 Tax=Arthrobacter caoxuetaonis TaxID=2886935 RepID=A0A9X1MGN5_9MICC|nr:hypothetical protein [Arthrobacter caoxuetaonis]MCC3299266.1 hypothetical protein [Arthrobacter caoxuetaonis]USQ59240.1 hypothetical protein NF551_16790 [Arthrobacter caoxuetaonis]